MKKKFLLLAGICLLSLLAVSIRADWVPKDGHKMHFPQLPNEEGWDVNATYPFFVADDWMCSATGPITEIHFWGSWRGGITGNIVAFQIEIYSDIPASPPQVPYSRPGDILWRGVFENYVPRLILLPESMWQGWYNPSTGEYNRQDHQEYWQYNIVEISEPFVQEQGTIYWLAISAIVEQGPQPLEWGWKTSLDVWNDASSWADGATGVNYWQPILEPFETISNEFFGMNMDGIMTGWGQDAYGEGWYFYPETGWWNIWFYDHPEVKNRFKDLWVFFFMEGGGFIEFALNWSTPEWSLTGNPPGDPRVPPLPKVDEDLYIHREILYAGPAMGQFEFPVTIPDYNPEWVSIDVRGIGVQINGVVQHACKAWLNQAFVINNPQLEPQGACCIEGGQLCVVTTEADCYMMSGQYNGDGSFCWGDLNGNGYDDICDTCCHGIRGDVDCSGDYEPDISDITRLVDFLYISHTPLCCLEEADVDGNGATPDISDITRLIDYLYLSHTPIIYCPMIR
ncbi:MAG: hypothetical protein PHU88_03670 [candidate division Zixibacteria bacterium]|nr:hypothetical protein [candidate division Zixibacteria bacterium]MDD5427363.1 hypothetical protein [candidate division Zixibacteria bacterium]